MNSFTISLTDSLYQSFTKGLLSDRLGDNALQFWLDLVRRYPRVPIMIAEPNVQRNGADEPFESIYFVFMTDSYCVVAVVKESCVIWTARHFHSGVRYAEVQDDKTPQLVHDAFLSSRFRYQEFCQSGDEDHRLQIAYQNMNWLSEGTDAD